MTTTLTTTAAPRAVHPGVVLAVVLVSYFMIVLDNSIVFTGLARIRDDLAFSTSGLSWVQNAYALVFGGLLLLAARVGDIVGRRRMFVIGLAIFSSASLLIGVAPSAEWMIAARALQGVGSAILAPTSLALLTSNFPEGQARTRALAAYGSTAGIGASLGLVAGGIVADLASWRWGFLINVPIGILLILAAFVWISETPRVRGRFDAAGAVTSTLGMTALVYGVTRTADEGWSDVLALSAIAGGVLLLLAFVLVEVRAAQPILPLRVLRDPVRGGAFIARMLFAGAMFGYFFFLSQYMQIVLGLSPLQAGLAFLPMTIAQFAISLGVPRWTARFGNATLVTVGLAITLAGMIWMSAIDEASSYATAIALPMLLLGAGQGLGFAPLTAAGVANISPRDAGAASGAVNVAHQLGGALGVSVMVAVASSTATGDSPSAMAAEASAGIATGAALLGIALLAAVTLVRRRSPRRRLSGAALLTAVITPLASCTPATDDQLSPTNTDRPTETETSMPTADGYDDGAYTARGWYGSLPSHQDVTLTVEGGVVTDVEITTPAEDETSLGYQERFAAALPDAVVGRPLDEISIDRLAGSSGCSEGFMSALAQIREDATATDLD